MGYIADEELRGTLPFRRYVFVLLVNRSYDNGPPRSREEELLYVLRKLLNLHLWPGTLWAALSSSPSQYAVQQPRMYKFPPPPLWLTPEFAAIETSLDPKGLITDAVRRSPKAHLFHFYHVFCEIASLPRKTPSAWLSSPSEPSAGDGRSRIAREEQEETKDFAEFDARTLARECLKAIGQEMGLPR